MHNHPYHMVSISPWPLMSSVSLMIFLSGSIKYLHESNNNLLIMGIMSLIICMTQWWRDVIRESTFQGMHNSFVMKLMQMGMIMFIISEIFFFISMFWAFFHFSLSPSIEIGSKWPPLMIKMFNPLMTPLLNTIVLLSSGLTITWTHYSLIEGNKNNTLKGIFSTIIFSIYFTSLQFQEYSEAPFSLADSSYGSIFFLLTGFHGIHVIIGTLFIIISMYRIYYNHYSTFHHFGFEASAWYWHFVDVIWLFVYLIIYWWIY
uniref:Cytochrome c oxidase subunit 3 n=1 Tax=Ichneumonidae sp. MT-2014 TaxID=1560014 RepID=A0A0A0RVQ5_9HYME|nr:cytochrome c oxidase subunit III [Ichneumonidae sp. MT-2014]